MEFADELDGARGDDVVDGVIEGLGKGVNDGLRVMIIKDCYKRLSVLFLRSSLVVLYNPYRRELL